MGTRRDEMGWCLSPHTPAIPYQMVQNWPNEVNWKNGKCMKNYDRFDEIRHWNFPGRRLWDESKQLGVASQGGFTSLPLSLPPSHLDHLFLCSIHNHPSLIFSKEKRSTNSFDDDSGSCFGKCSPWNLDDSVLICTSVTLLKILLILLLDLDPCNFYTAQWRPVLIRIAFEMPQSRHRLQPKFALQR